MACCKKDFLADKARNFRDYLLKYNPSPEVLKYIQSFKEDMLMVTLLSVVVPIVQTNTTKSAVTDLMKKLVVPDSEKADVAHKIQRYLEMFASVITS